MAQTAAQGLLQIDELQLTKAEAELLQKPESSTNSEPRPTSRDDPNGTQAPDDGPSSDVESDSDGEEKASTVGDERLGKRAVSLEDLERAQNGVPGPLHQVLESKIAELESAASSVVDNRADEEERRATKARKRQMKELRSIMDDFSQTAEEKLQLLHSKCLQQSAETRLMEKELLLLRRKHEQACKEKDTFSVEARKSLGMRHKLESLCRELQRQNKLVMEESRRTAAEEQQKRQELSTKFHTTIKEITSKLEEQGDERLRQIKENETEQHFAHQLRTKVLERQLQDAKLKQQAEIAAQEAAKARAYAEQLTHQLKTEKELRAQLALYGDKFEQFQRNTARKQVETVRVQKERLEGLCRTLQAERKQQLSSSAPSASPSPSPSSAPAPPAPGTGEKHPS
eukprot:jgi/Mesen1/3984/ME000210S03234